MNEIGFVVSLSDAGADPRAMMVVNRNAGVADTAMEHPRRLYNPTSRTDFAIDSY